MSSGLDLYRTPPSPGIPVSEPASLACVLYKGNIRIPGESQDLVEEGPPLRLDSALTLLPLSMKTSPRSVLGLGPSGRVEPPVVLSGAVPSPEVGRVHLAGGADSCSRLREPWWQAGPGWAGLGRAGPGLSPALCLATANSSPRGTSPWLQCSSTLMVLWMALLWELIFGPR